MRRLTFSLEQLKLAEAEERLIVETICEWERLAYGEGKHRTPEVFYECVKKNRSGFFVSLVHDKLVGYADVWELTSAFFESLRLGLADEESLSAEVVLARTDRRTSCWYIGSIIVDASLRGSDVISSAFVFADVCNALPSFFEEYSGWPAQVLGVGSSAFGKKLLTRWGFAPVVSDPGAIDLRPRYQKTLVTRRETGAFYVGRRGRDLGFES